MNDLSDDPEDPLVEVILLSRNDPDTGLRVLKTIEHYGLGMTRAIFMQGKSPYEYIPALNIALFLSGEKKDVEGAIKAGYPAGQVLESKFEDDEADKTLRIAFDFDGVLAGDESESIMQTSGLTEFHAHEVKYVMQPHNPGPLKEFMVWISDRTEGRIDAQTRNEIDGNRDFRLTMQTCVAALRLPVRMSVEWVSGCWWAECPDGVESAANTAHRARPSPRYQKMTLPGRGVGISFRARRCHVQPNRNWRKVRTATVGIAWYGI